MTESPLDLHCIIDFKDGLAGHSAGSPDAACDHLIDEAGLLFELMTLFPNRSQARDDGVGHKFLAVDASDFRRPALSINFIDDIL